MEKKALSFEELEKVIGGADNAGIKVIDNAFQKCRDNDDERKAAGSISVYDPFEGLGNPNHVTDDGDNEMFPG